MFFVVTIFGLGSVGILLSKVWRWAGSNQYLKPLLRLAKLRLLDRDGNPKHGFHHLGMHDVENITRCLAHLLETNPELEVNGWWK